MPFIPYGGANPSTNELLRLLGGLSGGMKISDPEGGDRYVAFGPAGFAGSQGVDIQRPQASPAYGGGAAGGVQPQPVAKMRAIGFGGGQMTDMGEEPARAYPIDYTSTPFEIPGVGKVYQTKMPGVGIAKGPDGQDVKVYLGYDAQASRQATAQNLAMEKTRADIAHTKEVTAQLNQPHWQLTPDGEYKFDPKSGQVSPLTVGGAAPGAQPSADGSVPQQGVPLSVSREGQQKRMELFKNATKDVQEAQKEASGTQDLEAALNRFEQLMKGGTSTGPIVGSAPVAWARGLVDPGVGEMKTIQNKLAMNNFKPGQGSMSNFERGLIISGGPNLANKEQANEDILNIMRGGVQNLKEKSFFKEALLANGQTNLLGADQAWQNYLDQNPRYTQDKNGRIVENTNRMPWQQFTQQLLSGGGTGGASLGRQSAATPSGTEVPPQSQRRIGQVYNTPKGPLVWLGNGWGAR